MTYYKEAFLGLIIYLLFGDDSCDLSLLSDKERIDIANDIYNLKMADYFSFELLADEKDISGLVHKNYKAIQEELPIIIPALESIISKKEANFHNIYSKLAEINDYYKVDPYFIVYKIKIENKEALWKELNRYIEMFYLGELSDSKENFYSYDKLISLTPYLFNDYYGDYGKTFNISNDLIRLTKPGFAQTKIEEGLDFHAIKLNLRLYELLLILNMDNYIQINKARYEHEYLTLNVTFNKTPKEIFDISKYWVWYGDIRVNATDGKAYYKNIVYPYKSAKQKAFKLLCFLVEHAGEKLSIEETYDSLFAQEGVIEDKKAKLADYIKEIKKNFNMLDEEYSSVTLTISGDFILLISNPPKK